MGTKMTIKKLKKKIDKMVEAGYGDLPITLNDDVLHEDDISFDYLRDGMRIKGMLYNAKDYERLAELKMDVKKAWEKFSMNGVG